MFLKKAKPRQNLGFSQDESNPEQQLIKITINQPPPVR